MSPEIEATTAALRAALADLVEVAGLNLHRLERGSEQGYTPDLGRVGASVAEAAATVDRATAEVRRLVEGSKPPRSSAWRFYCLDHLPAGPSVEIHRDTVLRGARDVEFTAPACCEADGCELQPDVAVPAGCLLDHATIEQLAGAMVRRGRLPLEAAEPAVTRLDLRVLDATWVEQGDGYEGTITLAGEVPSWMVDPDAPETAVVELRRVTS